MDALTTAYFVAFVGGAGFAVISWLLGALQGHGGGSSHGAEHGAHELHGDADADLELAAKGGVGHLQLGAAHAHAAGAHGLGHAHAHAAPAHAHGHAAPAHGARGGHVAHAHHGGLGRVVSPILNLSSVAALACLGGGAGLIARRLGAGAPLSLVCAVPTGLAAAYLAGGFISWLRRESRYKEKTELGGTLATVLAPVSSERLGEIMYLVDDARQTLPARSSSGTVLEPGAEVVILEVKDGIARVGAATELLGIEPAPAAATRRRLPEGEKEGPK